MYKPFFFLFKGEIISIFISILTALNSVFRGGLRLEIKRVRGGKNFKK